MLRRKATTAKPIPMVTSRSCFVAMQVIKETVLASAISRFLHIVFQTPETKFKKDEIATLIHDNCELLKTAVMRQAHTIFDFRFMFIFPQHSFFNPIEYTFMLFKGTLKCSSIFISSLNSDEMLDVILSLIENNDRKEV